jgi:hypothetical protein
MSSPSPTCWLYLDCYSMTGYTADQCPNRRDCRVNAKHSDNRSCDLPYFFSTTDPKFDRLFGHPEHRLTVVYCPEEALAAGWHPGEELFWVYRDNVLWIGQDPKYPYFRDIPPDAKGFARAERTPYALNSGPGKLIVTRYTPPETYPHHFLEAGWSPALDLPYFIFENDSSDSHDPIVAKGLYVAFDSQQPEYKEAIAAGWHPPVPLFEFEDPDHDFYEDDDDEW